MFSYEDRLKAIKLLIKYDLNYRAVMSELGYPSYRALVNCIKNTKKLVSFIKK